MWQNAISHYYYIQAIIDIQISMETFTLVCNIIPKKNYSFYRFFLLYMETTMIDKNDAYIYTIIRITSYLPIIPYCKRIKTLL